MIAAERGHRHIVELLLSQGADRNTRDNEGQSAHDLSTDPQMRALLRPAQ